MEQVNWIVQNEAYLSPEKPIEEEEQATVETAIGRGVKEQVDKILNEFAQGEDVEELDRLNANVKPISTVTQEIPNDFEDVTEEFIGDN